MAIFADNRKAYFNYEITEKYEAGIELLGHEVKSIKNGKVNLTGAFVIIRGEEAFIVGLTIQPYQPKNTDPGYEEDRTRRLLLSKKEIRELAELDSRKGLTLVPLSLYSKGIVIKVEVGVARGKREHDKRETIKKRDIDRELKRELK